MIRALVGIGVLQFASMLLLLVRTKVLAVTVGVNGVGTISTIDPLIATVAQTLSLSLPFAAIRFLPAALRDSPAETDLLYRRMRVVMVSLLVPATIICVAISLLAPWLWGAALVPHQKTLILAFAGLPVVGLVPFLTNAYAGVMGHNKAMFVTIAHAGVVVVAAIAAATGWGVDGFYAVYAVLGAMLVVAISIPIHAPGVRRQDRKTLSLREAFRLPPAVWRFGIWLLPLTFAAPYAGYFIRYSTVRLYGLDAAGILQGAVGISLAVRALLGAAHSVFLTPHVNRHADAASRMVWANEFQRTTGILFALTLPPLLLFSDVAIRVLYARAFVAGSAFVALFVATEVLTMLSGTYQSLILAGDHIRFHVLQNLTAQSVLAATAFIALPRIGLAGAGLAALSAPVFLFISTLLFLHRQYGVRVSAGAARMSAIAAVILVVAGATGTLYPGLSGRVLGTKAAVCVVIWIAALLAFPPEDRARLKDGWSQIRRRVSSGAPLRDGAA